MHSKTSNTVVKKHGCPVSCRTNETNDEELTDEYSNHSGMMPLGIQRRSFSFMCNSPENN